MSDVVLFYSQRKPDMNYSQNTNIELLKRLIGNRAAKRLYRGKLAPLFAHQGAPNRSHQKLAAARELVERWLEEELASAVSLSAPALVTEYLQVLFAGQQFESFVTIFLNVQNRLIAAEEMFRGTLTHSAVYPREIVKRALELNAAGAIFAHNHPSGVSEPSTADIQLTDHLKKALALVDIRVVDHFVIAGRTSASFAERGLL
jgi:DNA repair protein RadC